MVEIPNPQTEFSDRNAHQAKVMELLSGIGKTQGRIEQEIEDIKKDVANLKEIAGLKEVKDE